MTDFRINVIVDPSRAKPGTDQVRGGLDRTRQSADRLRDSLRTAFAGLGIAALAATIGRLTGEFTTLQNRLRTVVTTNAALVSTQNELFNIANRTRTPVADLANLYQRGATAANELRASQEDLLLFTETVGTALAIQGGSAAESSGALRQLSQALGSGIVRAEEFNSVLEGAFPLAQAAARGIDEAGGSVARLRTLVIEGEITSRELFEAINSQGAALEETFGRTNVTIGQSFTVLNNNLIQSVGEFTTTSGAARTLSEAILLLSDNIGPLIDIVTTLATVLAVTFAARAISATLAGLTTLGAGLTRLQVQLTLTNALAGRAAVSITSFAFAARAAGAIASQAFALIGGPLGVALLAITALVFAVQGTIAQLGRLESQVSEFTGALEQNQFVIEGVNDQLAEFNGTAQDADAQVTSLSGSLDQLAESRREELIAQLNTQIARLEGTARDTAGAIDDFGTGFSGLATDFASFFTGSPSSSDFRSLGPLVEQQITPEIEALRQRVAELQQTANEDFTSEFEELGATLTGGADAAESATDAIADLRTEILVASQTSELAREQFGALLDAGLDPIADAGTETAATIRELVAELRRVEEANNAVEAAAQAAEDYRDTIQGLQNDIVVLNAANQTEADVLRELISLGLDPVNDAYGDQAEAIRALVVERDRLREASRLAIEEEREAARVIEEQNNARRDASTIASQALADLERETRALQAQGQEREGLLRVLEIEQQIRDTLIEAGLSPDLVQIPETVREEIAARVELNAELSRQINLSDDLNRRTRDFITLQNDLQALQARGDITGDQANAALGGSALVGDLRSLDEDLFGNFGPGLQAQTDAIRQQQLEQIQIVRDAVEAKVLAEEEGAIRIAEINRQTSAAVLQAQTAGAQQLLSTTQGTFANLTTAAKVFAGEQSEIYGTLFAVAQAFALANAIVQTATGVTNALASGPPPFNFIQAAAVGAAGAAQIATIVAQSSQGFRDGTDFVTGPGGPRSDAINARLSFGEGVVNARANRANRGAVGFMNSGGQVEPAGRGGKRPVNVTFNFGPGTNVDDFKRSEAQIIRQTQTALEAV